MNDHILPDQPAFHNPSMPKAHKPTRGSAFCRFFLHAVHTAAICSVCVFHSFEPPFRLTLWIASTGLAASLTYALLAAAVGPHIPRRPALAHLVVAGTFLFSSLLAGILFAWQDWLGGYAHSPNMPLWRTFQAAGNGLAYGGIAVLLYFPLTYFAYATALTGTRRLTKQIFSSCETMTDKAASSQENSS